MTQQQLPIQLGVRAVLNPHGQSVPEIYDTVSGRPVYGVVAFQFTAAGGSSPKLHLEVIPGTVDYGHQQSTPPDSAERSRVIDLDGA